MLGRVWEVLGELSVDDRFRDVVGHGGGNVLYRVGHGSGSLDRVLMTARHSPLSRGSSRVILGTREHSRSAGPVGMSAGD